MCLVRHQCQGLRRVQSQGLVLDDNRLLPVLSLPTYEHDTRLDAEQLSAHAPASLAHRGGLRLHQRQSRVRWLVLQRELSHVRAGMSRDAAREQACAYAYALIRMHIRACCA